MKASQSPLVLKHVLADLAREILFLPIWWYTIGLSRMIAWSGRSVKGAAQTTGLTIWAQNLFVPMYGETTFSGKLISFFVRLVMIIVRAIATCVWLVFVLLAFAVYLVALPLPILGILYHGLGMAFV